MRCWLPGGHVLDLFVGEHVFLVMREGAKHDSMACWVRTGTDVDWEAVQVVESMPLGSDGIGEVHHTHPVPPGLWFVDPDDIEYVLHGDEPGVLDLYRALQAALRPTTGTAA